MKELNKTAIRFRGANLEHFGRSGEKGKLILIGKKQCVDPIKAILLRFIEEGGGATPAHSEGKERKNEQATLPTAKEIKETAGETPEATEKGQENTAS